MDKDQLLMKVNIIKKELAKMPFYLFTVIKGQSEDIISGRSDLDLRVIIDTNSIEEIEILNHLFFKIYIKLINYSAENFKLFEHPPLILNYENLIMGTGNINEIATWYFIDGNYRKFLKIKNRYKNTKFSEEDLSYFRRILLTKKHYDVRLELIFSPLDLKRHKKYCLAWHYYAPSIYAFASIIFKKRMKGKSHAFKKLLRKFPDLKFCNKKYLLKLIEDETVTSEKLHMLLQNELNSLFKEIALPLCCKKLLMNVKDDPKIVFREFSYALSILRNKIPRLAIYLSPMIRGLKLSTNFQKNLVMREFEDMKKVIRGFNLVSKLLNKYNFKENILVKIEIFKTNVKQIENLVKTSKANLTFFKRCIVLLKRLTPEFEKLSFCFYRELIQEDPKYKYPKM